MLALLIAVGAIPSSVVIVDPPTGEVVVAAERTATLRQVGTGGAAGPGLPNGAATFLMPLDPADRAPYAVDWSALLAEGETVADIVRLGVTAAGAALGIQIDTDPDRLPMIDDVNGKKVGIWLLVDPAFQSNAAFLGTGTLAGIAMLIRTSASPPKELERTTIVTVRQQ